MHPDDNEVLRRGKVLLEVLPEICDDSREWETDALTDCMRCMPKDVQQRWGLLLQSPEKWSVDGKLTSAMLHSVLLFILEEQTEAQACIHAATIAENIAPCVSLLRSAARQNLKLFGASKQEMTQFETSAPFASLLLAQSIYDSNQTNDTTAILPPSKTTFSEWVHADNTDNEGLFDVVAALCGLIPAGGLSKDSGAGRLAFEHMLRVAPARLDVVSEIITHSLSVCISDEDKRTLTTLIGKTPQDCSAPLWQWASEMLDDVAYSESDSNGTLHEKSEKPDNAQCAEVVAPQAAPDLAVKAQGAVLSTNTATVVSDVVPGRVVAKGAPPSSGGQVSLNSCPKPQQAYTSDTRDSRTKPEEAVHTNPPPVQEDVLNSKMSHTFSTSEENGIKVGARAEEGGGTPLAEPLRVSHDPVSLNSVATLKPEGNAKLVVNEDAPPLGSHPEKVELRHAPALMANNTLKSTPPSQSLRTTVRTASEDSIPQAVSVDCVPPPVTLNSTASLKPGSAKMTVQDNASPATHNPDKVELHNTVPTPLKTASLNAMPLSPSLQPQVQYDEDPRSQMAASSECASQPPVSLRPPLSTPLKQTSTDVCDERIPAPDYDKAAVCTPLSEPLRAPSRLSKGPPLSSVLNSHSACEQMQCEMPKTCMQMSPVLGVRPTETKASCVHEEESPDRQLYEVSRPQVATPGTAVLSSGVGWRGSHAEKLEHDVRPPEWGGNTLKSTPPSQSQSLAKAASSEDARSQAVSVDCARSVALSSDASKHSRSVTTVEDNVHPDNPDRVEVAVATPLKVASLGSMPSPQPQAAVYDSYSECEQPQCEVPKTCMQMPPVLGVRPTETKASSRVQDEESPDRQLCELSRPQVATSGRFVLSSAVGWLPRQQERVTVTEGIVELDCGTDTLHTARFAQSPRLSASPVSCSSNPPDRALQPETQVRSRMNLGSFVSKGAPQKMVVEEHLVDADCVEPVSRQKRPPTNVSHAEVIDAPAVARHATCISAQPSSGIHLRSRPTKIVMEEEVFETGHTVCESPVFRPERERDVPVVFNQYTVTSPSVTLPHKEVLQSPVMSARPISSSTVRSVPTRSRPSKGSGFSASTGHVYVAEEVYGGEVGEPQSVPFRAVTALDAAVLNTQRCVLAATPTQAPLRHAAKEHAEPPEFPTKFEARRSLPARVEEANIPAPAFSGVVLQSTVPPELEGRHFEEDEADAESEEEAAPEPVQTAPCVYEENAQSVPLAKQAEVFTAPLRRRDVPPAKPTRAQAQAALTINRLWRGHKGRQRSRRRRFRIFGCTKPNLPTPEAASKPTTSSKFASRFPFPRGMCAPVYSSYTSPTPPLAVY